MAYSFTVDTDKLILYIIVLVVIVLIAIRLIMRRMNLKQLLVAIVLSVVGIAWFIQLLGGSIGLPPKFEAITRFQWIPFGTLLFGISGLTGEALLLYLSPILMNFAFCFAYGLVWGITAPSLFKLNTKEEYIKKSLTTVLPFMLVIMFSYMFGISYRGEFDLANILFLALGCVLGWVIKTAMHVQAKEET